MSERAIRVSKAYWKKSHKAYYCEITYESGRRESRRLAAEEKAADLERGKILTGLERQTLPSRDTPVRDLLDDFLNWSEANRSKKTYKWHRNFLSTLSKTLPPKLKVSELDCTTSRSG